MKLVLIDGHSILNRAYYGLPELTNSKGVHTNAVLGFLHILFKILDEEKPDFLTVAFDLPTPTFRHKMFDGYKGTRKAAAPEFKEQVPLIQEMLTAMGVKIVTKEGYEADDILGTLSVLGEQAGMDVSIVSGDRDLLQLATDKVLIRIPKTKKNGTEIEDYYAAQVLEKYHVTPKQFVDVKALMGDSSDNISGVPGIGEKGATALIEEWGSIENAYAHVDDIKSTRNANALREHYDMAEFSKILATIKCDVDLGFNFDEAKLGNLFTSEAYKMCQELEFKALLSKFDSGVAEAVSEEITGPEYEVLQIENPNDMGELRELFINSVTFTDVVAFQLILDGDRALGLVLAKNINEIYFMPYTESGVDSDVILQFTRDVLETPCAHVTLGLKKQMKALFPEGVPLDLRDRIDDLEVMDYLLNPLKNSYEYETMATQYLDLYLPDRESLLGKKTDIEALGSEETYDKVVTLYANHAYVALQLDSIMHKELDRLGMTTLYKEIERPLIHVLSDMELAGIYADKEALGEYSKQLGEGIERLEKEIYEEAGEEFNISSPKQLGVILFEKLGLPSGKKTKTGYSTAADVLEKLAVDYPIVDKILEYRQLSKLKSTYADGLVTYISEKDGCIHSTFNQTITATGRISSTEPNLQNIPIRMELGRQIRKVFLPKEGYVFIDADYSQIELRVLAHMSGDDRLIEAYKMGDDIHAITASQVFDVPLSEVTPQMRRNAKAVNFGIVYGISSFGLGRDLSISREEASSYIKKYFKTYPQIKEYIDGLVAVAKEKGFSETMFGRIRPIPELSAPNFMTKQFGERIAMNSPIQGTAADIIKIAMINVHDRLIKEKLNSKLILQVHDELLVETKTEEKAKVEQIITEEMIGAVNLAVKLEIDMHTGSDWYSAK